MKQAKSEEIRDTLVAARSVLATAFHEVEIVDVDTRRRVIERTRDRITACLEFLPAKG